MSVSTTNLAAACAAIILIKGKTKKKTLKTLKRRKIWVKNWIAEREQCGAYENFMIGLRNEEAEFYRGFVMISSNEFDSLLRKITPKIQKQDTSMRKAISPGERLAVTLCYLATGDSYRVLMHLFRIPVCSISKIVPEVCAAIYDTLKDDYMKTPSSEEEWLKTAEDFENKFKFPNCIGALGEMRFTIKMSAEGNSIQNYNCRGTPGIILIALVDANHKFLHVESKYSVSKEGLFNNSMLADDLENNALNIPKSRPLPRQHQPVPFVVVTDDTIALKPYIMGPFSFENLKSPEVIYNCRLAKARSNIENLFGLSSVRFRVLKKVTEYQPERAKLLISTICVLHNFLMTRCAHLYAPPGTYDSELNGELQPGTWRSEADATQYFKPIESNHIRTDNTEALIIREEFKEYFVSLQDQVPQQYKFV